MRKWIVLIVGSLLVLAGCGGKHYDDNDKGNEIASSVTLFPTPDDVFVGDPMPYFDGEKMNIFFLEDQRNGKQGYHPWSRYTTTDFTNYEYTGVVIPYAEDIVEQDIALGTGSVIQDEDGIYHAFYTGHNDTYSPKEAIMHATSSDLQNWEKLKDDIFYADEEYSSDDFRDPYVLYNEQEGKYWMLITTRKADMGVIALYTSIDLIYWSNEGVLFENDMGSDSNLECPTLLEWNGYWYLSFSDQWPDRVVHVRKSNSPYGPFETARDDTLDYFDSNGFYAGRLEKDEDNLYFIGWNATKDGHSDANNYNWAGNLVVHQMLQKEDGYLKMVPVRNIDNSINKKQQISVLYRSSGIKKKKEKLMFSGADYEITTFSGLDGNTKITGKIELVEKSGIIGFAFGVGSDKLAPLNFIIDTTKNYLGFFNQYTDKIATQEAQSRIDYDFTGTEEITFKILLGNTVACLYINDELALTARMYGANKAEWGIFGMNSEVILKDIAISN